MRTLLSLAATVALVGCAGQPPATEQGEGSVVYRLVPEALPSDADCGDPSCTLVRFAVWVQPERGWIRSETEDGTGFETTHIFAEGALLTDHNDGPPEVRSGLPDFVGRPPQEEVLVAARASGPLDPGDRIRVRYARADVTFFVDEELHLDSPAVRELFEIPDTGITSRSLEPGTPSELVDAYWLGAGYDGLDAVTAVERSAPDGDGYFVFYGSGPESADALQIASESADEPSARRTVDRLGDREQHDVILADGERARLITLSEADGAYVVATRATLVGFTAGSRKAAIRLAEALRPVASR